jgi:signal transduction histidine kinase
MHDFTENRKVLIVDDEPQNLQLVGEVLRRASVPFILAINGTEAIEAAKTEQPALILLDVMMPKPNGFEVCTTLKAHPETADIPIIFLSAAASSAELVSGFTAGAVDYIKKPFIREELLARVFTHLNLSSAQRKLNQQSTAKADLIARLAHDIKNPSGAISGLAEILSSGFASNQPQHPAEVLSMLKLIKESADAMTDQVNGILDEARSEAKVQTKPQTEAIEVCDVIQHLVNLNQVSANTKECSILFEAKITPCIAISRRILIEIFDNLLSNAVKYSRATTQIHVSLTAPKLISDGLLRFEVKDQANTIPIERRAALFHAFDRGGVCETELQKSHGVGLAVVKRLVDMHSGVVGVSPREDGSGNVFYVELPNAIGE